MSWACISVGGGFESRECKWIGTIFEKLFDGVSESEAGLMAMYVTKRPAVPVVLYFTPLAARRFTAAVSRFTLRACDRPESEDVELAVGEDLASFTGWCELTEEEREQRRAEAYYEMAALKLLPRELLRDGDAEFYGYNDKAKVA